MTSVSRNRANGKRYEGELVKALRERGMYARLGRSNEEADVILPGPRILIELKSTDRRVSWTFGNTNPRKTKAQYHRLKSLNFQVYYAVRFKGTGIGGLRFYSIPQEMRPLRKDDGLTLEEFISMLEGNMEKVIQV
jgi:Holliday junction resolvase